jgi:hypothetical protein
MLPVGTPNGSTVIARRKMMAATKSTALSASRRRDEGGTIRIGRGAARTTGSAARTPAPQ